MRQSLSLLDSKIGSNKTFKKNRQRIIAANTHSNSWHLYSSHIGTDIPIRIVARSRSRSQEIRAYMAAGEDWLNRVNVSDFAALRCTPFALRETPESAAPRRRNAADVAAAGVKERTAHAIFKSNSNSPHSDNL